MGSSFANLRILLLLALIVGGYFLLVPHFYSQLSLWLSPWLPLVAALPYLLSLIIILVSWHFHNSKPAWVALIICGINFWFQTPEWQETRWQWTLLALLPVGFVQLSKLPERPLLSRGALMQLALLLLPAVACLGFAFGDAQHYLLLLTYEPDWLSPLSIYLPYPALIALLQLTALTTLLLNLLRYRLQQDVYLLLTLCLLSWLIYAPIPQLEHWLISSFLLLIWLLAILIYGHNLAYLDELTGLPGRRALNQARANLGRRHVIAMLDIDHFKQFNDNFGHDVGDQVLRMVASRIRQVKGGTAYRYGGEEFCILFPSCGLESAIAAAEEVRLAVAASQLQLRSRHRPKSPRRGAKLRGSGPGKDTNSVSVTISIGLAEQHSGEDTLKNADKKLYKAKDMGRNQCAF